MDDISTNSVHHASDTAIATPSPDEGTPQHHRILDLGALIALLGLVALVYLVVGDVGFSAIISAAAGLFGIWRARR
ncbi:hypothetical protein OG607_45425 [Streptomyces sp. NBC_01537]|uniref:hypothetical protein n=1 Tax=Streptomyces sp. NBC_01537 TaxID=2903896 RepID=UPI00386EFBD4